MFAQFFFFLTSKQAQYTGWTSSTLIIHGNELEYWLLDVHASSTGLLKEIKLLIVAQINYACHKMKHFFLPLYDQFGQLPRVFHHDKETLLLDNNTL